MTSMPVLSAKQVRRIAIECQGLSTSSREKTVMDVARRIRAIQIDPLNVVARTQLLVLFSRLGNFDTTELDKELWDKRTLFHYWAHAASIVLTEDYQIHALRMKKLILESAWTDKARKWMKDNDALRRHILLDLKKHGPLKARDFEDRSVSGWDSSGWTAGQNVSRMLDFLWAEGLVTIAGRDGIERVWARTEDWLPDWTPKAKLPENVAMKRAVEHSLRALGIGTRQHISRHFVPGLYEDLPETMQAMVDDGTIVEVDVEKSDNRWRGQWFMHKDDLPLIEATEKGWRGRTTLLSPFDNLIRDRTRTNTLWDFDFTIEIYVPKAKRKYGYYVLPLLDGDAITGRVDSKMDRKAGKLEVHAVHAEPWAAGNAAAGKRAATAIRSLGTWLGAKDISYGKVPAGWRTAFRA